MNGNVIGSKLEAADKLNDRARNMTDFAVHGGAVDVELLKQMIKYLREFGPYWDRHKGMDHIFLYSWGRMPCSMFPPNLFSSEHEAEDNYDPELRQLALEMRNVVQLQTENRCEDITNLPVQSIEEYYAADDQYGTALQG